MPGLTMDGQPVAATVAGALELARRWLTLASASHEAAVSRNLPSDLPPS
jgi:hypothetical protein